jgi:hypothetical protein
MKVFSNKYEAAYSKEEMSCYKNTGAAYQMNSCLYRFLTSSCQLANMLFTNTKCMSSAFSGRGFFFDF